MTMGTIRFCIALALSLLFFYWAIPKNNPYRFPKVNEIDKYNYKDDNGVCYKYERKYL